MSDFKLTNIRMKMLMFLLSNHPEETYGYQFIDTFKLTNGSVYGNLALFEQLGYVIARPEEIAIELKERRRKRTYYILTPSGLSVAEQAKAEWMQLGFLL